MMRTSLILLASAAPLACCATNPVTGEKDFMLVSEAQELSIGKQNYSPMRQSQLPQQA